MCTKRVTAICVWTCTHMQVRAPVHGRQVSCSLYWDRSYPGKQPVPGISPVSTPEQAMIKGMCMARPSVFKWVLEIWTQVFMSAMQSLLYWAIPASPCNFTLSHPHPRGVSHLRDPSSSKLVFINKTQTQSSSGNVTTGQVVIGLLWFFCIFSFPLWGRVNLAFSLTYHLLLMMQWSWL